MVQSYFDVDHNQTNSIPFPQIIYTNPEPKPYPTIIRFTGKKKKEKKKLMSQPNRTSAKGYKAIKTLPSYAGRYLNPSTIIL